MGNQADSYAHFLRSRERQACNKRPFLCHKLSGNNPRDLNRALMAAKYFISDALRAAVMQSNLLILPIDRSLSDIGLFGYGLLGRRSKAEAALWLYRVWPATIVVIPISLLLILYAAGRSEGWGILLTLLYAIPSLYAAVFTMGLVAGAVDRNSKGEADEMVAAVQETSRPGGTIHIPDNLKSVLAERIKGQDLALEELSNALIASARKYAVSGKAFGMYLLVGATGSGKTETAKQLSEALGWPLYREECNQYATEYSITRLIGAAAGYRDSEQGGSLTNALRASRHGILLLDEIEKAHPSVSKALMTLADEGVITTGLGEVVDARGWLVLATSNAAQREIVRIAEAPDMASYVRIAAIKKKLEEHWAPEIVARIRSVVPYKPVDADSMRRVFEDELLMAYHEAGAGPDHKVSIEPAAIDFLSKAYETLRQYGVREIKSLIARDLDVPLIRFLEGEDLWAVISSDGDRLIVYADPESPKRNAGRKANKARFGFFGRKR